MNESKDYADKAVALFLQGYNCCQAVFAACCERFGMDLATGLRLTAGMGGGMGGMREKCGAVTGMFLLAGLRDGGYAPEDDEAKKRMYALVKELDAAFAERCSSTNCKALLEQADCAFSGVPSLRDAAYYEKRPCATLVAAATDIAAQRLIDASPERTE